MSVDEMIRAGLEEGALGYQPRRGGGLEEVLAAGRRRRATRQLAVVAAAALVAVVVGMAAWAGSDARGRASVPAATPSLTALEQLAEDARLTTSLVGTWSTPRQAGEADALAALDGSGNGAHRAVVLRELHLPGRFDVRFDERTYTATMGSEVLDEGAWHVKDGRLVLTPTCGLCRVVLAPTLEGDSLRLRLLEDPSPDYLGIPDAAFASVVWTALPYERAPASGPSPTDTPG